MNASLGLRGLPPGTALREKDGSFWPTVSMDGTPDLGSRTSFRAISHAPRSRAAEACALRTRRNRDLFYIGMTGTAFKRIGIILIKISGDPARARRRLT